jgi:hypothetical protein
MAFNFIDNHKCSYLKFYTHIKPLLSNHCKLISMSQCVFKVFFEQAEISQLFTQIIKKTITEANITSFIQDSAIIIIIIYRLRICQNSQPRLSGLAFPSSFASDEATYVSMPQLNALWRIAQPQTLPQQ